MTKTINFIFFFVVIALNVIALSSSSLKFAFTMIMADIIYLIWLSGMSDVKIFEITGVTWLQKKFKNNELIMDMTKE